MALLNDYIQLCRLHRPIGIWLVMFPGFLGLSMAFEHTSFLYWIIFIIGAVVMRSAGCIYNDIIDRPFDGSVKRTHNRPLVRLKQPLSLRWAVIFLCINLMIGCLCLFQLNILTIGIGCVTALMIILYPWMKRITYWPQLFLGLTMNMGYVIGTCAVKHSMDLNMCVMYMGMVFWTLGYDTIYGFQDIDDDALIGLKSATLKVKSHAKLFLGLSYSVSVISWVTFGYMTKVVYGYYVGILIIVGIFSWQIITLNTQEGTNCLKRFQSNQWVAIILWAAFMLNKLQ